jgi:hypothetical protein
VRLDAPLIARLEAAYGASAARYARRRAAADPTCGARVLEMREGVVVVDSGKGGGSNAHCAYGLAMAGASDDDLDRVERFYAEREGAPCRVMATPPVHASLHEVLARRGYVVTKQSALLVAQPRVRTLARDTDVRALDVDDVDAVLDVMAACYGAENRDVGRARALPLFHAPATMFGAFVDDVLAACGALVVEDRVGLLFAGMTRPSHRGRRLQSALIEARVAHACALGLDVVTSLTEPASTSERNVRRAGFVVACTQSVWSTQRHMGLGG